MRESLRQLFIKPDHTIKEAMRTITKAGPLQLPIGISLVVDSQERLIGTVTDGDIRKALVKGRSMDDSVAQIMTRDPITVDQHLAAEEMLRVMMRKVKDSGRIHGTKVEQVIVTSPDRRVVDVLDFHDLWHRQEVKFKRLCVVGTGHVGLTLAVVLAEAGCSVTGFDIDEAVVRRLKEGKVSFYEVGLESLLKLHLAQKNITFTSRLEPGMADAYIVSVGTPVDFSTKRPDLKALTRAAEDIGRVLKKDDLVVLRSTVAVGTTRGRVLPILERASKLKAGDEFFLAFAPERVVEGRAIEETKEIPQVLAGIDKRSLQAAARLFQTVGPSVVMLDTLEEAEMVKLVNNTFRDHSFSFANNVAMLCGKLNLDSVKILRAANEGYTRNPVPLPSPGVGGYCLTKDPYLLADAARCQGLSPETFTASRAINERIIRFVADKTLDFLKKSWPSSAKKKIFMLGFAFKGYPETSDIRGSTTLDVLELLRAALGRKAVFFGYDPVANKSDIEAHGVRFASCEEGFKEAHAVLLMNNSPEFAKIDVYSLLGTMRKPAYFFDGWRFYEPQEIKRVQGVVYQGLGGGY